jgi:electron transfer flavoprotein alpha subunit
MQFPPRLLLFPASSLGEDLAPRVAVMLGAHYAPDARLEIGPAGFEIVRTIFRRKYLSREPLNQPSSSTVMTLRVPDEKPRVVGDEEAEVVVVHAPVDASPQLEIEGRDLLPYETLATARVVVAGGGGLPDAASFDLLRELAHRLGAVPAASPTACDRGIAPRELRVGLDGSAVEADLYLAFGVSGSSRHLAALAPRAQIVAVNTDPEAPIFNAASHKLVADAVATIRSLLDLLERAPREGAR